MRFIESLLYVRFKHVYFEKYSIETDNQALSDFPFLCKYNLVIID